MSGMPGTGTFEIIKKTEHENFLVWIIETEGKKSVYLDRAKRTGGAAVIPAAIDNLPVTHLGRSVFMGNEDVTSIAIPSTVIETGNKAFLGCSRLQSFTVDKNNAFYTSAGGVLFDKGLTTLICFPCAKAGGCAPPPQLLRIADYAFAYCKKLTGIVFPQTLLETGKESFTGCEALRGLNLPGGLKSTGIRAFEGCVSITELAVPSLETIAEGCFSRCTGLVSAVLSEGVKTIGPHAFDGCTSLRSVTLPKSLVRIEDYAFNGCEKLEPPLIPPGTETGKRAFAVCHVEAPSFDGSPGAAFGDDDTVSLD